MDIVGARRLRAAKDVSLLLMREVEVSSCLGTLGARFLLGVGFGTLSDLLKPLGAILN